LKKRERPFLTMRRGQVKKIEDGDPEAVEIYNWFKRLP
jgi:hypothetical protein